MDETMGDTARHIQDVRKQTNADDAALGEEEARMSIAAVRSSTSRRPVRPLTLSLRFAVNDPAEDRQLLS